MVQNNFRVSRVCFYYTFSFYFDAFTVFEFIINKEVLHSLVIVILNNT